MTKFIFTSSLKNRVSVLTILILFNSLNASYAADRCEHLFTQSAAEDYAPVVVGTLVSNALSELPLTPNAKVYLIGEGKHGSKIYRVEDSDSNTKIYKVYQSAGELSLDIKKFKILEVALSVLTDINHRFLLPSYKIISSRVIEFEDVRGAPLSGYLVNPSTPKFLRMQILYKFIHGLQELKNVITREYPDAYFDTKGNIFLRRKLGDDNAQKIQLNLNTDNIIVNERHELVVIDPSHLP